MSNQSGNVILGTLIGAAVGFAAGILLAPQTGKETRDLLGDKAADAKNAINDATHKAMASLKEVKESVERSLKGDAKLASNEAERLKNQAKSEFKNV